MERDGSMQGVGQLVSAGERKHHEPANQCFMQRGVRKALSRRWFILRIMMLSRLAGVLLIFIPGQCVERRTLPYNWDIWSTHPKEREEKEKRGGRQERERRGCKSQRETPCVGMSGRHSAACLQSVILTSFPDKQISMLEKYMMIEASTCSRAPPTHIFLWISNKRETGNQEEQSPFLIQHVAPFSPTPV